MIKKFLLIIPIILVSLFFMNFNTAFATDDINMNMADGSGTDVEATPGAETTSTDTAATSEATDTNSTTDTTDVAGDYTPETDYSEYSTTESSAEGLDISNILSIFLIVLGILLVLLSIAILIRLKH